MMRSEGEALLRRLAGAARGAGARRLRDAAFAQEAPPARLGLRHLDDDLLCRDPPERGRGPGAGGALGCGRCGRAAASPHLLDLHLQEEHDSFFAALAATRPSYGCYVEECTEKFMTPAARFDHCVKVHKLPKDFRFYQKTKIQNSKNDAMEVDDKEKKENVFSLSNGKQKAFTKSCNRSLKSGAGALHAPR